MQSSNGMDIFIHYIIKLQWYGHIYSLHYYINTHHSYWADFGPWSYSNSRVLMYPKLINVWIFSYIYCMCVLVEHIPTVWMTPLIIAEEKKMHVNQTRYGYCKYVNLFEYVLAGYTLEYLFDIEALV